MKEQLMLLSTLNIELAVQITAYIQAKLEAGDLEMEEADVMLEILQEAVTGDISEAATMLWTEDEYVQAMFESYLERVK